MTEKEDDKLVGMTLRMLREKKDLTLSEFSIECDKSPQQLHEYEAGKKSPSPYNLLLVLIKLGISRSEFFILVESGEAKKFIFKKPGNTKKNNSALL
jgi:transcriptional regulator with XRE-family HTH domain